MQILKPITLFFLICFSLASAAQTSTASQNTPRANSKAAVQASPAAPKESLNAGSIESQFKYIYNNSNNFQEYKVVRKTYLDKIQSNITDSLNNMRARLATVNNSLETHDSELNLLQDSLAQSNTSLQQARKEKESFTFLGIMLSKTSYNVMVWSFIFIILIALLFFIYRFRQSHNITSEAKRSVDELREDFDKHRKRAMEREQRLNRQLQDEINKKL